MNLLSPGRAKLLPSPIFGKATLLSPRIVHFPQPGFPELWATGMSPIQLHPPKP